MKASPSEHEIVARVTICNERGLHARAAAKFVRCAGQYSSQIWVLREDMNVAGTSLMGLLMLGAGRGAEIEIRANGQDAQKALDALVHLVMCRFDETT